MANHFHLLLYEKQEGGISKFMQRLGGSMTLYFNEKYGEKGSIFQGAFKSSTVSDNEYLHYVHAYILVKNTLENYPGGIMKALREFDTAWNWIKDKYLFTSFLTAATGIYSPIIDMKIYNDLGLFQKDFKIFARDMLFTHISSKGNNKKEYLDLYLEEW